jgi:hypothetical protein
MSLQDEEIIAEFEEVAVAHAGEPETPQDDEDADEVDGEDGDDTDED